MAKYEDGPKFLIDELEETLPKNDRKTALRLARKIPILKKIFDSIGIDLAVKKPKERGR